MAIFSHSDLPFSIETEDTRIFARYIANGAVEPSNRTELLLMVLLSNLDKLSKQLEQQSSAPVNVVNVVNVEDEDDKKPAARAKKPTHDKPTGKDSGT